jgi:hypothetical protein
MRFIFIILLTLITTQAKAQFFFQNTTNYQTDSDTSTQKLTYENTKNITFLGAHFGKSRQQVIGQNVIYWTRNAKENFSGKQSSMNMLELGPRLQWFMNEGRNAYIAAAYNIYAKGTRVIDGTSEEVSGSSYLLAMGIQLKIEKSFFVGVSFNYHSLALDKKTIGTTETKISDSYTNIFPALEFSLRFR